MMNSSVLLDFEMKNVMVLRQRNGKLVRRYGWTCGGTHRLLSVRKQKTLMDNVLSLVSPGVHPILKVVWLGG